MRETPDQIITRMAAPKSGICRRDQLRAAGVGNATIARRLSTGYLEKVIDDVYVVPALANTDTELWAAVLAVPNSAVARESAARLHRFQLPATGRTHLLAAKGVGRRRIPGTVVHETRLLRGEDLMTVRDLPVTSPERTLVDLAAVYSKARLTHLIETHYEGERPDPFAACVDALARPGVPGLGTLRELAVEFGIDDPLPASELERRLWHGLAAAGLVGFRFQYRPPWYDGLRGVVDLAHPDLRLVLEADGRRFHNRWSTVADDNSRDRMAAAHDWLVLRVTWREVVHRPAATFEGLAKAIASRERALDTRNQTRPLAA